MAGGAASAQDLDVLIVMALPGETLEAFIARRGCGRQAIVFHDFENGPFVTRVNFEQRPQGFYATPARPAGVGWRYPPGFKAWWLTPARQVIKPRQTRLDPRKVAIGLGSDNWTSGSPTD